VDYYTDKAIEHFSNPRNIGIIEDPTVLVQVGDPGCGDSLLLTLNIADDRIVDIKYKIIGCGAAIATSSIASEMAMNKTLDEALLINDEAIAAALNGLPIEKMHCSLLAASAIHSAILEYRKVMASSSDGA
jgi:nitrogen fixation NifU-like protein